MVLVNNKLFSPKDLIDFNNSKDQKEVLDAILATKDRITNPRNYEKGSTLFTRDCKFKPDVAEKVYHDTLKNFRENPAFFSAKEGAKDFTLDISTGSFGKRITLDLKDLTFYYTDKKLKSNIDFCCNGRNVRVSAALEVVDRVSLPKFIEAISDKLDYLRVKQRERYTLNEELEIAFTQVNEFFRPKNPTSGSVSFIENLQAFLSSSEFSKLVAEDASKVQDRILSLLKSYSSKPSYEIEVEHLDIKALSDCLERVSNDEPDARIQFKKQVASFIKNSQLLFFSDFSSSPQKECKPTDTK
jgi:hypothetical protein